MLESRVCAVIIWYAYIMCVRVHSLYVDCVYDVYVYCVCMMYMCTVCECVLAMVAWV